MRDDDGIIQSVFREMFGKVANKIINGEFEDLLRTPAPAQIHIDRTYLEGAAADLLWSSRFLTKAAQT